MRRKSERTATRKAKPSPEKKVEKVKRTRSRRKKQSTSSENESGDEASPAPVEVDVKVEEPPKPPKTPVNEDSPEEAQDQVWRVKAADGSGDTGEIKKLKICLTRPPSTPERPERSPRSKRKLTRATSSSDATSVDAPEEKDKKKTRRSKRSHRESNDELDKSHDSQGEEPEAESASQSTTEEVIQSEEINTVETSENTITTSNENVDNTITTSNETEITITTSNETEITITTSNDNVEIESTTTTSNENVEIKATTEDVKSESCDEPMKSVDEGNNKHSVADTTVVSPQVEPTVSSAPDPEPSEPEPSTQPETVEEPQDDKQEKQKDNDANASPERRQSESEDKSEILELHAEESKCESDLENDKSKTEDTKEDTKEDTTSNVKQVSEIEEHAPIEEPKPSNDKHINVAGVVEISDNNKGESTINDANDQSSEVKSVQKTEETDTKLERSDSIQSNQEESLPNGQAAPIVVSRKRRWGSRSSKVTSQKSITISTDVLKDIIPDVKPVEFDEVLEDKKPRREVVEKIERPILPKIVIDNTENVERNNQERRELEKEKEVFKPKESQLAVNRKISIIKDTDTIIKPPSPPRHKQSCVLYITNLVRPFTLQQLKNLLQRTGRIAENGFWIDKIKSKCYVVYETEDQAIETRHALHGVTWPVSNPKTLQVDFSTPEAFEKAKSNEESENAPASTIPGTVEDWLREQDQKRQRGEVEKPWERKSTREWDLGKNENEKEKEKQRDERPPDKRRHRSIEISPEPARKFKKKEEEAPAKLLDDLFKKTKTTPCIYWLPLSAETIAIKEEQRRQHMAEYERRMQEQRRPHRRH